MQIGEIARKAGLSVRAVRYYEELGLIRPDAHSTGGFRLYGEENLKRLQVIGFLKEAGFSLREIREAFLAKKPGGGDKGTVDTLLRIFGEKLRALDSRLSDLRRMRDELGRAMNILSACKVCEHKVLLDAMLCRECSNLTPREAVPDTLEIMLR
jgi:DNA-binding transcriptional MerR regulator